MEEFTLDEINTKVHELSNNDPRFYTKSFNREDLGSVNILIAPKIACDIAKCLA